MRWFKVVAFACLGIVWAFASPPGSSNDDEYHMASIWCAWGDSDQCTVLPAGSDGPFLVSVPETIAKANCAQYGDQSAACVKDLTNDRVTTYRVNSVYNPSGFYRTMRVLASDNVMVSVLLMRLTNVALAAALLAWAAWVSSPHVRRGLFLGWGIAVLPLGMFYIASTNPSAWVIASIGVFWAFLLTALSAEKMSRPRRLLAASGVVASAVIAATARYDSFVWLGISGAVVAILAIRPLAWTRRSLVVAGTMAVALSCVAVLAFLFNFDRLLIGRFTVPDANIAGDHPNPITKLVLEMPAFAAALFGGQPAPWVQGEDGGRVGQQGYTPVGLGNNTGDTLFASATGYLLFGTAVTLVVLAVAYYRHRNYAALSFLALAGAAAIIFARALAGFQGQVIQPRYLLPLLMVSMGVALTVRTGDAPVLRRGQAWLLVAAMTIGSSLAWLVVASRYAVGQTAAFTNFGQEPNWWWEVGPSRLMWFVLAVGCSAAWAMASIGAGVTEGRLVRPRRRRRTAVALPSYEQL